MLDEWGAVDEWATIMVIALSALVMWSLVMWLRYRRIREQRIQRMQYRRRGPVLPLASHHLPSSTGTTWPVRTYIVGVINADEEPQEMQEWRVTWPQARDWAAERSKKADVREAWVIFDDEAGRSSTVWSWKNGQGVSRQAYPWRWQSRIDS
ncbi:hypothetical protein [Streptosporangium sp. NPDC023615]|uniref:hypothetical protein n=1 Tax=Streptosporangium sp. NPDC023615 TaxID=3154794 RepID=UPI00343148F5